MHEPSATRARMRRLTLSLAALLIALCAVPGMALAQDDEDPYGGGAGEPCTSVICEGGVPDDGDDPYGGGAGEDPYGGGPLSPGDGEPCTSVICEAEGGTVENTSGEGTDGEDTDSGGSDEGAATDGALSSGSGSDGDGDEGTGGGSVTSAGDAPAVSSVTLARTGFDARTLGVLSAIFLAAGSAVLFTHRRRAPTGS